MGARCCPCRQEGISRFKAYRLRPSSASTSPEARTTGTSSPTTMRRPRPTSITSSPTRWAAKPPRWGDRRGRSGRGVFAPGFDEDQLELRHGPRVELRHSRLTHAELRGDGLELHALEVVQSHDEPLALEQLSHGLGQRGPLGVAFDDFEGRRSIVVEEALAASIGQIVEADDDSAPALSFDR